MSHPSPAWDASIVVIGFHRPVELDVLLESIDRMLEVIVVVVDADDQVAQVANRHGATVVRLPGNPGYAAAVNAGVARATGEIVLFCNDDLRFELGAIDRLVTKAAETGGAVVPLLLDVNGQVESSIMALVSPGRLLWECAILPDRRPRWAPAALAVKWRQPAVAELVPAAMAAAVAVPRTVLLAHPLPVEYFLYWEEQEWCHVLTREGIPLHYEPSARVVHRGGRGDVRGDKNALLARNAVRCVRRTSGPAMAALAWPVVVLWWLRLVATDLARCIVRPSAAGRHSLMARFYGVGAAFAAVREIARPVRGTRG